MKRWMIAALLLTVFLVGVGCNQIDIEPEPEEPQASQEEEIPGTVESPVLSLSDAEEQAAFEDLRAYLPAKEGFVWYYSGYAEYGHVVELKQLYQREDSIKMVLQGEIDDVSGETDPGELEVYLEYVVENGRWIQKRDAIRMMGPDFKELILLQYPLEVGNQWIQEVQTSLGESLTLTTRIEKIDDAGAITVSYVDETSGYAQERIFSKGLGVIGAQMDQEGAETPSKMGYALYREASGYPLERAIQAWLPPKDQLMLYYGLAEYAHRATLVDIEYFDGGRRYLVEGDFEYDGSGIPGTFRVSYEVDGVKGTVREIVLENTRAGEPILNSQFPNLLMLSLPLEAGATWTQKVSWDGSEALMRATITEMRIAENGHKQIYVRYEVPASGYYQDTYFETRVFEEGRGLIGFASLMPGPLPLEGKDLTDPVKVQQALDNHQFGYGQNPLDD